MSERTLVPIFIFWALLTIITPTLILLSENSKTNFDLNGNSTMVIKSRRIGCYTENHITRSPPPTPPVTKVVTAVELASVSAATPIPSPGSGRRVTPIGSYHNNHTLGNNRTYDGHMLSPPKIQIKVKETNIRQTIS